MAEDISTLVLRVQSEGIEDGTKQLRSLTRAAKNAEEATKKLGTVVITGAETTKKAATAAAEFNDKAQTSVKVTSGVAEAIKGLTVEQKRDLELWRMRSAEYARAVAEGKKLDAALERQTKGHGSNAAAMRESMVLIHELSQGSYKRFAGSLLVMANYMNLIPKLMDAIGAASKGMQFAVLGSIAAVGMVGYIAYRAASELKHFENALILTGNAAGMTIDSMNQMAHAIGEGTRAGVGGTRTMIEAMAATGRFNNENIRTGVEALTTYSRLSGQTAEEVAKHFAKMGDGVVHFAMEHNKSSGAFSAGTMKMIYDAEKLGDRFKAQQIVMETLAAYYKTHEQPMSDYAQGWVAIGNAIAEATHNLGVFVAKKLGMATNTTQDKINAAQGRLDDANTWQSRHPVTSWLLGDSKKKEISDTIKIETAFIASLKQQQQDELLAAEKQAKERELNVEGAMAAMKAEALLKRIRDNNMKEEAAVNEWNTERAKMEANGRIISAEENEKVLEAIHEKYAKKRNTPVHDGRAQERDEELVEVRSHHKALTEAYETYIHHSKSLAEQEDGDRWGELANRKVAGEAEIRNLADRLNNELAVLEKFHGQTVEAIKANEKKKAQARAEYVKSASYVQKSMSEDEDSVALRESHDYDKLLKSINTAGHAEKKRLEDQLEAYTKRLTKMEELKSTEDQREADKAYREALQQEDDNKALENLILLGEKTGIYDEREIANFRRQLELGKQYLQVKRDIVDVLDRQTAATKVQEAMTRNSKIIDDELAGAKRFEKAFTDAFGNIGKAIGGIGVAWKQMAKDNDEALKKRMSAPADDMSQLRAAAEYEEEQQRNRMNGYANMAQAASNFFDKQSHGFRAMNAVAQAFHLAQLARNVVATASGLAAGAAQFFAQSGWGGFAGVAAMGAVMAGLGYSMRSFNKGGDSAETVQKQQGTGTVLGSANKYDENGKIEIVGEKADSISKSLEYMSKDSTMMLPLTQAMTKSLKNIETAMTGVANLVYRTDGVQQGTNLGIQQYATKTDFNKFTDTILGTNAVGGGIGGAAIGALIAGPLGAVAGAALGGIVGSLANKVVSLWGGTKQSIVDSGIQFGGSVNDLQSGNGYNQYASVDTTKKSWFGLSKKTTNEVVTGSLSSELSQQFGLIFTSLEDSLKLASTSLGKTAADVGKTIDNLVIETTKLSLKDLKGDELTKALNAVLSKTMDQISEAAFPEMGAFRQVGEGYAQTVLRVASDVEKAQFALKEFGITAIDYTQVQSKTGDVMNQMVQQSIVLKEGTSGVGQIINGLTSSTEDLIATYRTLNSVRDTMKSAGLGGGLSIDTITGAGGLDKLANSISTYQDKYFSAQEKTAMQTQAVTAEFAKLGMTLPESRDALRSYIEAAAAAGDQTKVGQLLALTDAFDKIAKKSVSAAYAAEIADKKRELEVTLLDAQGDKLGAVALQRAAELKALYELDPALADIQKSIYDVTDATAKADAKRNLEVDLLNATGNTLEATKVQRQAELATLAQTNPELVRYKQALYAVSDATQAANARNQLQIDILTAQGNSVKATALQRKAELEALSKTNPELVEMKVSLYRITDAMAAQNAERDLHVKLLNAQEREAEALVIQRKAELDSLQELHPELVAMQKLLYKVEDSVTAFKKAMTKVDQAFKVLQASVEAEKKAVDKAYDLKLNALKKTQELEKKAAADAHKSALDSIKARLEADKKAVTKAYDLKEKENSNAIDLAKDQVSATKTLLDSLKTSLEATANYDAAIAHANALRTVRAAAKSGNSAGYAGVDDAIKELAKPTDHLFGTLLDYQRSQAEANEALNELKNSGESQLSEAQRQLDALTALKDEMKLASDAEIEALENAAAASEAYENARYEAEQAAMETRHEAEQTALEAAKEAEIAKLDDIITKAQVQIDALNDIDSSVKTLNTAIGSYTNAVAAATAAAADKVAASNANAIAAASAQAAAQAAASAPKSFVEGLYNTVLGRAPDAAGLQFWNNAVAGGASQSEVLNGFINSAEFQGRLPSFDKGTNELPEDMLALVHKGERIVPAADNAELKRRLKDNAAQDQGAVSNEELKAKLDELIEAMKIGDTANVQKTNEMFRILREWNGNGMPPTRPTS